MSKYYPYDPEKARALLEEAGYPNGFPLELWAYREKPVAEAVTADLEAVGIDVNLRYVKLESLEPGPRQARDRRLFRHLGIGRHGGHRGHRPHPLRRFRPQPVGRRGTGRRRCCRRADHRPGEAQGALQQGARPDRRRGLLGCRCSLLAELSRLARPRLPARSRRPAAASERAAGNDPAGRRETSRRPSGRIDRCSDTSHSRGLLALLVALRRFVRGVLPAELRDRSRQRHRRRGRAAGGRRIRSACATASTGRCSCATPTGSAASLTGDFGESYYWHKPVAVARRRPRRRRRITLALSAIAVTILIAIPLGALAALNPNS